MPERTRAALDAGCDMVLICNDRSGAEKAIDALDGYSNPLSQVRLVRMHGKTALTRDELFASEEWIHALHDLKEHTDKPTLSLDS